MAAFGIRMPQVDWTQEFGRHWNDGNPAATHAFNALSFLFPDAERYFVDVVRELSGALKPETASELVEEVKKFIAQEMNHCRHHTQLNAVLRRQGYENVAATMVAALQRHSYRHFSPLGRLAIVCAYEHYTAILGNYILTNAQVVQSAHADMALIWGWHGAEETEHKSVCFDLYRAVGGGWLRRVALFMLVTPTFAILFARLYLSLLSRDRSFRPRRFFRTVRQVSAFFFGRCGVGWFLLRDGFHYLSPLFHPSNQDNRSDLQAWLVANDARLSSLGNGKYSHPPRPQRR